MTHADFFDDLAHFTDKQLLATAAADDHLFALYGGSRGPGKSRWLRWWLLRFLLNCAEHGLRGVRVGLFCETYPDLEDRQISKMRVEFPLWLGRLADTRTDGFGFHLRPEYGGGMLALRNLDDPSKYQSAEFAAIGVDELTKNPVTTFNTLRGSLRWPGIRNVRFVAATNPGGIGHLWVKAYFLDREYPPELERYREQFAFVPALPDDNPYLDSGYWDMLDTLPPDLARAWRWGDWDVFAGQAFSEWKRERHVIAPVELPKAWPRWRAVDWGRVAPFCCLWFCQDPDTRRVYVPRELYETELTDRQQARLIAANSPPAEKIKITYGDPSMWTKKSQEDRTFSTADEYRAEGILLTEADNDRLIGKRKVHTLLANLPDGKPGLLVFETCTNLIRTLPALVYDPANVEDVDTDGEDHAYDTLRYGLTSVKSVPQTKREVVVVSDPIMRRAVRQAHGGSRDL